MYTFLPLSLSLAFSSLVPFSLFASTSSFAPYCSYSDRRSTSDSPRISIDFFPPPARCLCRDSASCICRNDMTYPTEIDTLYARGYRTLLRAVVTSLTLSSGINAARSTDFDGNNWPALFLSFFLSLHPFLSVSFPPPSRFRQ